MCLQKGRGEERRCLHEEEERGKWTVLVMVHDAVHTRDTLDA
jgi:hypothetical protein